MGELVVPVFQKCTAYGLHTQKLTSTIATTKFLVKTKRLGTCILNYTKT